MEALTEGDREQTQQNRLRKDKAGTSQPALAVASTLADHIISGSEAQRQVHHEKQVANFCGLQAFNSALQGPVFSRQILDEIAEQFLIKKNHYVTTKF